MRAAAAVKFSERVITTRNAIIMIFHTIRVKPRFAIILIRAGMMEKKN